MKRLILFGLVAFVFVFSLKAAQFDPDLSLYLSFDEIDNDGVKDLSGNGNDGVLTKNANLADGKYDQAMVFESGLRIDFDGANFVAIPEEAVTLAVWVNIDNAVTMEVFDCIGAGHDSGQYHVEIRDGGAIRWFHRDETNTQVFSIQQGNLPTGEWAHIAGTYDSKAGEAVLYINGAEVTRMPGNGTLSTDWTVGAGIGQHKGGRQFLGLMDEFYIFKRALDADEIVQLMEGQFGPFVAVEPAGKLATTWGEMKF